MKGRGKEKERGTERLQVILFIWKIDGSKNERNRKRKWRENERNRKRKWRENERNRKRKWRERTKEIGKESGEKEIKKERRDEDVRML